jgi:hypothetical protein
MMKRTMMALAALPVTAVLVGSGVAVGQAAGPPPGTAVVQQATVHHGENPCHGHPVTRATPVAGVPVPDAGDNSNRDDPGMCGHEHAEHGLSGQVGSAATARVHHGEDHGEE